MHRGQLVEELGIDKLQARLEQLAGKITAAEKPDWERRLKADFTNEKAALDKLTPKIKTASAINRGDAKLKLNDKKGAKMDYTVAAWLLEKQGKGAEAKDAREQASKL